MCTWCQVRLQHCCMCMYTVYYTKKLYVYDDWRHYFKLCLLTKLLDRSPLRAALSQYAVANDSTAWVPHIIIGCSHSWTASGGVERVLLSKRNQWTTGLWGGDLWSESKPAKVSQFHIKIHQTSWKVFLSGKLWEGGETGGKVQRGKRPPGP